MATPTNLPRIEWADGLKQGLLLGAAVLVLVMPPGHVGQAPPALVSKTAAVGAGPRVEPLAAPAAPRRLELGAEAASADVRRVGQWVVEAADNAGMPFAILDKKGAKVFVFEPDGRLRGASPVLLGYAPGDDTVPGIGTRPIAEVRPEERTTPAGRFVSQPGRNLSNEDVIWVDYDAAVSMHRVRPNNPRERRLERLASPGADDNRISYGCINLPIAFFDEVAWPALQGRRGVVYVLPEVKPLQAVFPAVPAA